MRLEASLLIQASVNKFMLSRISTQINTEGTAVDPFESTFSAFDTFKVGVGG